jgi:hypothetical protein
MAATRGVAEAAERPTAIERDRLQIRVLFYLGVPGLTALLFGLNQAGMARLLPSGWAVPYWLGITIPLWALLDLSSRGVHLLLHRFQPHRWLMLLGGALIAMALFSPYIATYASLFAERFLGGRPYSVSPPFPEAFLDLRRFAAYSGVPIYWIAVALFFARYFKFPPYLVSPEPAPLAQPARAVPTEEPAVNAYGLPERSGFRSLLPYHLGLDFVSLRAEDHYVRVVTERGNALIRYRFSDALGEVRGLPGIQVHRSHWVAVRAIERVRSDGKGYRLTLHDGSEVPVSRSNVGVLKAAGLI